MVATCPTSITRAIVFASLYDFVFYIVKAIDLCRDHFFVENAEYDEPTVHAFTKILDHNYSKYTSDKLHDIRETIEPASLIPSKVFTGFKKACHTYYKFDSKTEKDLAIMLEDSSAVKKWLRPANGQFNIYWSNNSRMYVPDFVAETDTVIYLVETKADNEISDTDTQAKAKAAVIWCDHATKFTTANGGKLWKYSLIPQAKVMFNNDILKLLEEFKLD